VSRPKGAALLLAIAAAGGALLLVTNRDPARDPGPGTSGADRAATLEPRHPARQGPAAPGPVPEGGASSAPGTEVDGPHRPSGLRALTASELDRLLAATGARGVQLLADDRPAREAHARIEVEGAWAWAATLRSLTSTDTDLRTGAAAVLGVHPRPEMAAALSAALEREDDATAKRLLLDALVGTESVEATEALLRIWRDARSPEALRLPALRGLATLGHLEARALVQDERADATQRRIAELGLVRALRRSDDDPALVALVTWIADSSPNESARLQAREALEARERR